MSITEFRPSAEVLTRFAQAFSEDGYMKKTPLHSTSRVNWYSFERYINWLIKKKYIKCKLEGKHITYEATEQGKDVFNNLLKLTALF